MLSSQLFLIAHGTPVDSKTFQKTLQKQGMKFKLSTKVISAKKNSNGKVDVVVEPAKGGPQETVRFKALRHYNPCIHRFLAYS